MKLPLSFRVSKWIVQATFTFAQHNVQECQENFCPLPRTTTHWTFTMDHRSISVHAFSQH